MLRERKGTKSDKKKNAGANANSDVSERLSAMKRHNGESSRCI